MNEAPQWGGHGMNEPPQRGGHGMNVPPQWGGHNMNEPPQRGGHGINEPPQWGGHSMNEPPQWGGHGMARPSCLGAFDPLLCQRHQINPRVRRQHTGLARQDDRLALPDCRRGDGLESRPVRQSKASRSERGRKVMKVQTLVY
jgi:hypothetical protein